MVPRIGVEPPKSVEELLYLNNATKHLDVLLESGYDDINYICETGSDELEDIGIVDRADREQVIHITGLLFCLLFTVVLSIAIENICRICIKI